MFQLSEQTQLIILIIILAVLFVLVIFNNKRNQAKKPKRNFRKGFYEKTKKHKNN